MATLDRGIVEDMRLKSPVRVGMSQGAEGVVLVPSSVPVEPFKFCQFFGEVSHFLVGIMEALDFSLQGGVPFSVEGEIDHGGEGFVWVEGVCFFPSEYVAGVWVCSSTKWS